MKLSKNNIRARVDYLNKMIFDVEKRLNDAPAGRLRVSSSNGSYQFYFNEDGCRERYIDKSEMPFIKQLAQKEYDSSIIRTAISERTTLEALLNKYARGAVEDIYEKLIPARRALVKPIFIPDDEFIRNWLDEPYEKAGFSDDEPVYLTSRNLRVRSKSEVFFADKYDEYNIPFRYEVPLYLKGYGPVRPDFELLDIRYRRILYHEHLGMMDDPAYAEKNIRKVRAYEENGYTIGKNLIITMETENTPIGPRDAELVINGYFR